MPGNTFGQFFKVTTFGESHGKALGGIVDGCPAGLELDEDFIRQEMGHRKPGDGPASTMRKEADQVHILSGVFEGKTTGTPISFVIYNEDAREEDYRDVKDIFRPSQADYSYQARFGLRDYRGGGRASGRETAARVAAGAIARILLKTAGISISAYTAAIGEIRLDKDYRELDLNAVYRSPVYCPDEDASARMSDLLDKLRKEKDTIGGTVNCIVTSVPPGYGDPVFDKLQADLAKAVMSIGGAKGFEYGAGFRSVLLKGSEMNDPFYMEADRVRTRTNHAGGISGGISNGEDIYFRVAFKAVSSIGLPQETVDKYGNSLQYSNSGRHDVCLVPRAVPVVEAMTALVMADHLLRFRTSKI